MMLWFLIAFSAITAFVFRLLPFLLKESTLLNNTQSAFYRFLGYSTQCMLGVIIYNTAFKEQSIAVLFSTFNWLDFAKVALLTGIFIFVAKTKNLFAGFFGGLLVYFICLLVFI